MRDGAHFANGDLIDKGGVRDECGGGDAWEEGEQGATVERTECEVGL